MDYPDLEHLVRPRSIAVIGASGNVDKGPGRIIQLLDQAGFVGSVYPVNPRYESLNGRKCYDRVEELPEVVDLVVVMVPAAKAVEVVRASAKLGVKFAVILSSGFREVGGGGVYLQEELVAIASEYALRIYGPNCPGMFMVSDRMAISFSPRLAIDKWQSGSIALVTQGGAMGRAVLDAMETNGRPGFTYWFSPGNEADLQAADFLGWLARDEATKVVLLILESFRDGKKFMAAAEECRRVGKPVVVLKVGRSAEGVKATSTHTAALAGEDRVVEAVLKQIGATRVNDIDELVDLARVIERYGIKTIAGVGICTLSGGSAALVADMCGSLRIPVPQPSVATTQALEDLLPPLAAVGNPVDLTTDVFREPALAGQALEMFLSDPSIDCVLFPFPYRLGRINTVMAEQIVRVAQQCDKPIIALGMSEGFAQEEARRILIDGDVPVIESATRGVNTLRRYIDLVLAETQADALVSTVEIDGRIDEVVSIRKPNSLGSWAGCLSEEQSESILVDYGIPFPAGGVARSEADAVSLAEVLGFPVVLKIAAEGVAHKSDAGLVLLNVVNGQEVRNGYRELARRLALSYPGASFEGVRVAELVGDGLEVLCGIFMDPSFGPVVTCGLGGIYAELLDDVSLRVAPIDMAVAHDMIEELRGYALMAGARGNECLDVDALAELLVKLSQFADENRPRLVGVDVNPLKVRAKGRGAVALDALIILNETGVVG
jgi:acetyltransferase